MCLDGGEVIHGRGQGHGSGCDVTPAGACCFLWRRPSSSGDRHGTRLGCLRRCVGGSWIGIVRTRSGVVAGVVGDSGICL